MTRTTIRRLAASAFAAAAVASAVVMPAGTAQADHDGYRVGDDYVRVLVYWHQHPDWGIGSSG